MTKARLQGRVFIEVGQENIEVRFTWSALDVLATKWGADWQDRVNQMPHRQSIADLADLLEVGTGRPAAWWYQQSPPVNDTMGAVFDAIAYAFAGPGGPAPDDPPKAGLLARLTGIFSKSRLTPGST